MEHFQWDDYSTPNDSAEIASELADVVSYCLFFAVSQKIDLARTVEAKLEKVAKKYPISLFNQHCDKGTDYMAIKKSYRVSTHS